jgi:hypothetical protein
MNIKKKNPQEAAREDFNDVEVFLNRKDNQFYYLDRYRQPVRLVPESLATDKNNQILEIGGEGDELVLIGGSLNGASIPDSVIPLEQLAQGIRLQELNDVPAYSGNALKGLRVNGGANAIEYYIASDTDNNSWGMDTVAFVSPSANPGTGAIGFANTQTSADTSNTAFRTVAEANASGANLIFLLPGNHSNVTATNGKTYYAFPGVDIYRFRDGGASAMQVKLRGHARITYGVELTGSFNKFDIECDRFESRLFVNNSLSSTQNFVTIKADKMNQLYTWGGGFAVRTGNDSEVTIECNEMELLYWFIATRSYNCTYTVRCPKVKVKSGGGFGNQYKSFVNHQGSVAGSNVYDIDFIGGEFETLAPQTSSFGISDSALLLCPAMSTVDESQFIFSNGRVKANAVAAVQVRYQVRKCRLELKNLDITCNTNAFSFWNQAINQAGQDVQITFKDCNIESNAFCQIGNARFVKFYNTNIKVLTGANVINFQTSNGATPGTAYFVNCNFDLVDPGEVLTNFTGISVGLANCYGDQPIGATVTDLYGGYSQLTPFELPNLLS